MDAPITEVTKKIFTLTDGLKNHPADICGALVWAATDYVQRNRAMSRATFLKAVSETWDEVANMRGVLEPHA